MAYVLLDENNVIIQKDVDQYEGFIEAPDSVVCGQIKQGDNYVNPVIPIDDAFNVIAKEECRAALTAQSDPLFFKWQAGEGTEEAWLNKRKDILNQFKTKDINNDNHSEPIQTRDGNV